ncbi:MAG: polysaccharide export protein [Balneolales bacterium]|nr:polysaccharide export protein [Balneolales bacterium]
MTIKLNPYFLYPLIIVLMIMTQACSSSRALPADTSRSETISPRTQPLGSESLYVIRPGDELEILVWEQPSFNTLTTVSRLGTIAIPLVGEVVVVGLTQAELRRVLEGKLAEYIRDDINLTISIRNTDTLIVSVLGYVARPDNYPVVDQTSIFRIISTAGGFTEDANLKKVKLYRQIGPEAYVTLDLLSYLESGQMNSPTILVQPGDIVYVPRQENVVREMSDFLRDVIILFGIFRIFG